MLKECINEVLNEGYELGKSKYYLGKTKEGAQYMYSSSDEGGRKWILKGSENIMHRLEYLIDKDVNPLLDNLVGDEMNDGGLSERFRKACFSLYKIKSEFAKIRDSLYGQI